MTPVDPAAWACLDLLAGAGASGSFPERRLKHIIYVECTYAVRIAMQYISWMNAEHYRPEVRV